MKLTISKWSGGALCCAISLVLLGTLLYASSRETSDVPLNEKAKVTGVILSRAGDMVRIKNKKSGHLVVVNITDSTKIERKRGHLQFFRHADMDVTAMVPAPASPRAASSASYSTRLTSSGWRMGSLGRA